MIKSNEKTYKKLKKNLDDLTKAFHTLADVMMDIITSDREYRLVATPPKTGYTIKIASKKKNKDGTPKSYTLKNIDFGGK